MAELPPFDSVQFDEIMAEFAMVASVLAYDGDAPDREEMMDRYRGLMATVMIMKAKRDGMSDEKVNAPVPDLAEKRARAVEAEVLPTDHNYPDVLADWQILSGQYDLSQVSLPRLQVVAAVGHQNVKDALCNAQNRGAGLGLALLETKRRLPHGEFLPWLRESGIGVRTAQRYMALADPARQQERQIFDIDKFLAEMSAPEEPEANTTDVAFTPDGGALDVLGEQLDTELEGIREDARELGAMLLGVYRENAHEWIAFVESRGFTQEDAMELMNYAQGKGDPDDIGHIIEIMFDHRPSPSEAKTVTVTEVSTTKPESAQVPPQPKRIGTKVAVKAPDAMEGLSSGTPAPKQRMSEEEYDRRRARIDADYTKATGEPLEDERVRGWRAEPGHGITTLDAAAGAPKKADVTVLRFISDLEG